MIGGGVGCEGCGGDGCGGAGKPYFTKNKKIPWLFLYEDRIFTEKIRRENNEFKDKSIEYLIRHGEPYSSVGAQQDNPIQLL